MLKEVHAHFNHSFIKSELPTARGRGVRRILYGSGYICVPSNRQKERYLKLLQKVTVFISTCWNLSCINSYIDVKGSSSVNAAKKSFNIRSSVRNADHFFTPHRM
jgi:hypothetical protein